MKPRLRYISILDLWLCNFPDWRVGDPLGAGLTPAEAYEDWLRELAW